MIESETIKVVHPAAENVAAQVTLQTNLPSVKGATIALVDSRRSQSDVLMRSLDSLLREAGAKEVITRRKVATSTGLGEGVIRDIASKADAVIFGVVD